VTDPIDALRELERVVGVQLVEAAQ
jgi:hypothetical protein